MQKQIENLVLIDTGNASTDNNISRLPHLYSCLKIMDNGDVHRVSSYPSEAGQHLGVRDLPLGSTAIQAEEAARSIAHEAERVSASGVFADFERAGDVAFEMIRALADELEGTDIPLYVPLSCSDADTRTIITAETAISEGSLATHLQNLIDTYGQHRIAAFIHPVSSVFDMPTQSTEGKPLLGSERDLLLAIHEAEPYFSPELYAKYFTYTDELGQAHFVLFDDASTMAQKLALLDSMQVHTTFITDADAMALMQ